MGVWVHNLILNLYMDLIYPPSRILHLVFPAAGMHPSTENVKCYDIYTANCILHLVPAALVFLPAGARGFVAQ